jgi:hypothetical protein
MAAEAANPYMAGIEDLSELSRKLNKKSDSLNRIISSVNEKLEKMNIGLEVWLEDSPLESSDPEYNDRDENMEFPIRDVELLGYCRIDGKWMLAVKSARMARDRNNWGQEYDEVKSSTQLRPLLDTNRTIRTEAMRAIPELIEEIKKEALNALDSIEEAEKAAEKL